MKLFLRLAVIAALLSSSLPSLASQGSGCMPTSGTVSGLTLVQDINAANAAFISMNSGATAPLTDCSGASMLGQLWLDTTSNTVKVYDGASWLPLGKVDASSHVWTPRIGGGTDTLVAGTTTNLGNVAAGYVTITGGTTISSFSNTAEVGTIKLLKFSGTPTLTYSANLLLPTGLDVVVTPGDQAAVVYLGGNVWSVWAYTRVNGTSLSTTSIFNGAVNFASPITPTALATTTNDWSPTGLLNANVIRVSSTGLVYLTGIVAPTSDGKILSLYNVGTASILLVTENAGSSAANRFTLRSTYTLRGGGSVALIYDATAARWKLFNEPTTQSIAGGFKALLIKNNASAPTTTMDITADQITVEEIATGRAHRLSSVSVSPVMTASGANGLDTGTIVNNVITWYYEYVIYNPVTDVAAGLFSAQSNCASVTMPLGYTFCARVGAVRTDGAATARWMGIRQAGRTASYAVGTAQTTFPPMIAFGNAGAPLSSNGQIAASVANFVPPTAVAIDIQLALRNVGAMTAGATNNFGGINSTTSAPLVASYCAACTGGSAMVTVGRIQLESGSVYWANNAATDGQLVARGWEDNL